MNNYDVLIVGAGHSGAQAAIALRQQGFAGSIALVGEEPMRPYERPPLSKEYLAGTKTVERMLIRPAAFWTERSIALLTVRRVTVVDSDARVVETATGESFRYDQLIWAAGGSPRRLECPGHDLAGVHTLRTCADADRLKAELPSITHVVVIGGGFIGLEVAATLRKLGTGVTLVEALDRVLARVAGEPVSRFFEAQHRANGVEIRLGSTVACLEGKERVTGVRLGSGETLACDAVVVGIGIVPTVGPLIDAGAKGSNGVAVDSSCRTSLCGVFAIGDAALHSNRFAGGAVVRLESVQNANDQALVVARSITGKYAAYDAMPWFWSNQFDLKMQTIGLSLGHDDLVLRGAPEKLCFSVVYLREGCVVALDCINSTKDYVEGRLLIAAGTKVDRDQLANADIRLKTLLELPSATLAH